MGSGPGLKPSFRCSVCGTDRLMRPAMLAAAFLRHGPQRLPNATPLILSAQSTRSGPRGVRRNA